MPYAMASANVASKKPLRPVAAAAEPAQAAQPQAGRAAVSANRWRRLVGRAACAAPLPSSLLLAVDAWTVAQR